MMYSFIAHASEYDTEASSISWRDSYEARLQDGTMLYRSVEWCVPSVVIAPCRFAPPAGDASVFIH